MFFYSYYSGHGREILVDVLGAEDPFGLAPADIVERIIAAGYTPVIDQRKTEPWTFLGTVTTVARNGQAFMVAVSRDGESIGLQEIRADAYDPIK